MGNEIIEATQTGIGTILKNYTLHVDPHQREYAWKKREVTALFQDLYRAMDDGEDTYFLRGAYDETAAVWSAAMKWTLNKLPGKPRTVAQLQAEIRFFEAELSRTKSPDRLRRAAVAIAIRKEVLAPMLRWRQHVDTTPQERQRCPLEGSSPKTTR